MLRARLINTLHAQIEFQHPLAIARGSAMTIRPIFGEYIPMGTIDSCTFNLNPTIGNRKSAIGNRKSGVLHYGSAVKTGRSVIC